MSLRPEVRGIDLDRLWSLFGSGDEAVIRSVADEFDRSQTGAPTTSAGSTRATFHGALERAIREGQPFPDLDEEGPIHVQLAVALAKRSQDLFDVGSNSWKYPAFVTLYREHADKLDARGRSLLGCFLKGRPIFGKRIVSDWSYYGFLHRRDTATLRDSIRSALETKSGLQADPGAVAFASDLAGWLDAIDSRGEALWFWFA